MRNSLCSLGWPGLSWLSLPVGILSMNHHDMLKLTSSLTLCPLPSKLLCCGVCLTLSWTRLKQWLKFCVQILRKEGLSFILFLRILQLMWSMKMKGRKWGQTTAEKGFQQPLTEGKPVKPIYTDLFCFYTYLPSQMNKEQAHLYSAPGRCQLAVSIYLLIIIRWFVH